MEAPIALGLLAILSQFSTWAASIVSIKSPLRGIWSLLAIGVNVACFFAYDKGSNSWIEDRNTRAVLSSVWAGNVFGAIEKLLCSKWNLDAGGPEDYRPRQGKSSKSTSGYTIDLLANPRGVGKPWQVKGVPPFSSTDPKYVPSRTKFLAQRLVSMICCILIVDLCAQAMPANKNLGTLDTIPVLSRKDRLPTYAIVFRMISTVIFWLRSAFGLMMVTDAASIVAVGSRLSNIQDWPPLMGSPAELYTIRKFWGTVWHQQLRVTFDGISNQITHDLLHMPQGKFLSRYLKIWISFLISGLIHAGMAEERYDVRGSGTVRFFCTQALGIMLEDGVQELWSRIVGNQSKKYNTPTWRKSIGFVWLLVFLSWSTPVWSYRMFQYERPGIDHPLGFSIVSQIL